MGEGTEARRHRGTEGGKSSGATCGAFTLVELLVVVAIVGTLVGVLLPALSGARARAWQAGGASNIRQLQLANAMYGQDHERYMPGAIDVSPPANVRARENTHRWHGTREAPSGAFTPEGGSITGYLDGGGPSAGVRRCPAFASELDRLEREGRGFESGCGGYAYNAAYVGCVRRESSPGRWVLATGRSGGRTVRTGDDTGAPRHWFGSPARTVAFADAALAGDGLVEYSFVEPPEWPEYPGARPDPSIHFRHQGLANVCWLDGHVSAERRTFTAWSGVYGGDPDALGLGWFGDADEGNGLFDYE